MVFKSIALCLLIWFLSIIHEVFTPFILGGIIAYLLSPVVKKISQLFKVKNHISVLIIYISILCIITCIIIFFGHSISAQFKSLFSQRKEIIGNIVNQISQAVKVQIDTAKATDEIVQNLENNFGRPQELLHIGSLVSKSFLETLVTVVTSIYFILDNGSFGRFFLRFFPKEHREPLVRLTSQMNTMLSKYVRGQILLIFIMASIAYIFLHFVFKLKYALLISIFSGFFEIIPILGPIIATSSATIVGIAQLGIPHALWIVVFYTLARWIEDYVVVPRIIGHAVELHPIAVIFAVLCGEILAGGLGMLIAIPVAASIKLIIDFYFPVEDSL